MNWLAIEETTVRTGKITVFLDTMQSTASMKGEDDPLPKMIADVVARIRAALSTGNALDADASKVPTSLEGLALRMILRRIKSYLEYPLSADETSEAKEDASYLNQIAEKKLKFETPDDPAGSGEMQGRSGIEVGDQVDSPTQGGRVGRRERLGGLL